MNILIVGCGSIGSRRAHLLSGMGHEVVGYDPKWDIRQAETWRERVGAHATYADFCDAEEEWGSFDAAMICTPPDSVRVRQVDDCLKLGVRGLFVEKPLALTQGECGNIAGLATKSDAVTMGACNLRFTEGVADLAKVGGSPKYGRFTMGQHARYWSKDHKPISLVLDSIHELDLAVHLLGPIESIRGRSDKRTALASVHHIGGNWSQITLDRVHEPPVRIASVESPTDAHAMKIKTGDAMYEREMAHFLACVESGEPTTNPIEDAAAVCMTALEIA